MRVGRIMEAVKRQEEQLLSFSAEAAVQIVPRTEAREQRSCSGECYIPPTGCGIAIEMFPAPVVRDSD